MVQQENKNDVEEEYLSSVEEIIEYLQTEEEYIKKCLKMLYCNFYDIYSEINCGYIDKIYFENIEKVFIYDKETDSFILSDIPYNQEEEYIIVIFNDYDMENRIPHFNYLHYNTTDGILKTINKSLRKTFYLKNRYNKLKGKI